MVDARGYGQDFSRIPEHANELLAMDSNIMFSAHMYEVFNTDEKVQADFATIREAGILFIIGEFACTHGAGRTVACDQLMQQAENPSQKIGTIAWSYTGNNMELQDLDVVEASDWKTLTGWGDRLVNSPNGVRASSKEACIFASTPCMPAGETL